MSSKQKDKPKLLDGRNFIYLRNGCIVVARQFDRIIRLYEKEPIPDYLLLIDHGLTLDKDECDSLVFAFKRRKALQPRRCTPGDQSRSRS